MLSPFRTDTYIVSDYDNRSGARVPVRHVVSTKSSSGGLYNGDGKLSGDPQYSRHRELAGFLSYNMELDLCSYLLYVIGVYADLSHRDGSMKVLATKSTCWGRIQVLR